MRKPTESANLPPRPRGAVPGRSVAQALESSATLAALLGGHRRSYACFALITPLLPPLLRTQVRPGPIAEKVWTLFAANGGAAAKLRQALPNLIAALADGHSEITEIHVKVVPPAPGGGSQAPR